jgi:hypothetical protein
MRYNPTVRSRSINDDGTMTLFVVLDSEEREPDLGSLQIEPELDLVGYESHFKNDKLYSISLRFGAWTNLVEGSPITLIWGE